MPPQPLLFSCLYSLVPGDGEEDALPHCNLQVYTYTCDVGKRENVYSTAERVRKEVGEVSVLVNNAGVVSGHHLLECPDELIERTMMVNCHAHFWVNMNSILLPILSVNSGKRCCCWIPLSLRFAIVPSHLQAQCFKSFLSLTFLFSRNGGYY